MVNTNINETWNPYLKAGEDVEIEFLNELKKTFPLAYKVRGKVKETDIVVPELGDLLIEIKRDFKSDETGNFAIEYWSWNKPSGIATTLSELWVMTDKRNFYIFSVSRLKEFMRNNWKYLTKTNAGDSMASKIILVKKKDAIKWAKPCIIRRIDRAYGEQTIGDYISFEYRYRQIKK